MIRSVQIVRSPRTRSTLRAVLVEGDVQTAGNVRDISSSGLFIEAPLRLAVGQRFAVSMGDLEGVRVPSEVVRVAAQEGAGLRFLGDDVGRLRGLSELVLHGPDDTRRTFGAGNVVAPRTTVAHKLVVVIHGSSGARRLHAVEVGHAHMFIVTDEPPRAGARVHLTVQLPTRSVDVVAEVALVVVRAAHSEPGFGVKLLALPDDDRAAWDGYVRRIADGVRVVIRPRNLAELRAFAEVDFHAAGTRLFTQGLCSPGDCVSVVVVHPLTGAELALRGIVVDASERPRSMDVHFFDTDARAHALLQAFVECGAVRTLLALPAPLPPLSPLSPDAARAGSGSAQLLARIAALEEELAEAEHTERSLFARVHELEARGDSDV